MSDDAMPPVPIESLGADLRERRRKLVGFEQPTRSEWEADLVGYDNLLQRAAAMLDVEVALQVPFTPDQRARVEQSLATAGLEIRTVDL